MLKNFTHYKVTCPFCKRIHKQRAYINTICSCGGKFYFNTFLWLNRATGEKFYTLYDVEFLKEEEE